MAVIESDDEFPCPYCLGHVGPFAPCEEPDGWFNWICRKHGDELIARLGVTPATDEDIEEMKDSHAQCLHPRPTPECADADIFRLIARIEQDKKGRS